MDCLLKAKQSKNDTMEEKCDLMNASPGLEVNRNAKNEFKEKTVVTGQALVKKKTSWKSTNYGYCC